MQAVVGNIHDQQQWLKYRNICCGYQHLWKHHDFSHHFVSVDVSSSLLVFQLTSTGHDQPVILNIITIHSLFRMHGKHLQTCIFTLLMHTLTGFLFLLYVNFCWFHAVTLWHPHQTSIYRRFIRSCLTGCGSQVASMADAVQSASNSRTCKTCFSICVRRILLRY